MIALNFNPYLHIFKLTKVFIIFLIFYTCIYIKYYLQKIKIKKSQRITDIPKGRFEIFKYYYTLTVILNRIESVSTKRKIFKSVVLVLKRVKNTFFYVFLINIYYIAAKS